MSAPVLLEARGLCRSFRRRPVLRDVSLCLRGGEIAGVVGENGAGKTTLLEVLAGLLALDAGEVHAAGSVGYSPQDPRLFPALTIREHFRYFAAACGLRDVEAAMARLLEQLRFAEYAGARVDRVSGGTRQKLSLSLALLGDPAVLLLDEPYSALDWASYLRFWELAAALKAAGRAVLIVSNMAHDRGRFDALYALDGGEVRCA